MNNRNQLQHSNLSSPFRPHPSTIYKKYSNEKTTKWRNRIGIGTLRVTRSIPGRSFAAITLFSLLRAFLPSFSNASNACFFSKKSPPTIKKKSSPFSSFSHIYIYHPSRPKFVSKRKTLLFPFFFSSFFF